MKYTLVEGEKGKYRLKKVKGSKPQTKDVVDEVLEQRIKKPGKK